MLYFEYIGVIILFLLFFLLKRNEHLITGRLGEKFVSNKFKGLDPERYIILDNLLLPSQGNTASTQLDHVIVSNFGIFCIETKGYKGWIFGNAKDANWTQVVYKSKHRFYNPLRQNYAHVKAVERLVSAKYPRAKIYSFVVFPYADKLKITGTDAVGYTYEIVSKIKTITTFLLTNVQRDDIVNILGSSNIIDQDSRRDHINSVKNIKKL